MFEVSLEELQNGEVSFRKFKLVTENVQSKFHVIFMTWILGQNVFHGQKVADCDQSSC